MADVKTVKQIVFETPNKVGMLAEVTDAIASAGANIQAICAYAMEGKAIFMLVADDIRKASAAVKSKGFAAKEGEVVAVSLVNKVGSASGMAKKLKGAGIDLNYIYGSVGSGADALIVLDSSDNKKAVEVLK